MKKLLMILAIAATAIFATALVVDRSTQTSAGSIKAQQESSEKSILNPQPDALDTGITVCSSVKTPQR